MDIRKDLEAANFIPSASASKFDGYMSFTSLCLDMEDLIPFVKERNKREQLRGNKTMSFLCSVFIGYWQLTALHPRKILFCVGGMWFSLNAKVASQNK